ncbi:MAG TPA: thiamine phosphate synthase [Nevskiaceae bacterium]
MTPPKATALRAPLHGLIAVTPPELCADNSRLMAYGEAVMHSGARLLRYHDERLNADIRRRLAAMLVSLSRHFGTGLLIDDDIELARALGADGVYLDRESAPIAEARAALGAAAVIGCSCGMDLERARRAAVAGADYVNFGPCFPAASATDGAAASLKVIERARQELAVPIAVSGGIRPDNAPPLLAAGAALLATAGGVFEQTDVVGVAAAADRYVALFPGDNATERTLPA